MDDADAPREMPSNVREPLPVWRIHPLGPKLSVRTLRVVSSRTPPGWRIAELDVPICRVPLEQREWDLTHRVSTCRACSRSIYLQARSVTPSPKDRRAMVRYLADSRAEAEARAAQSMARIQEARARRACHCEPITAPIDISELLSLFEARRHLSMLLAARDALDQRIAEARDELARLQADESGEDGEDGV